MNSYDLAIAYRIYPKVAEPALGLPFSDDKLRLSEICLRSFRESLGKLRVKLWVVLDGCPEEYAGLFRKYFDPQDLISLPLPGVGNQATFGKQIDILLGQEASDLVYFAEDDYFYLPNQFPRMVEFLRAHKDVDFVSPYDHLDCYTLEIHRHPKWLRVHAGHHWRTAASTCMTFLTRKETLRRKETIFRTYWKETIFRSFCLRNNDCSLWLSLTRKSLFNPARFLRFLFREPRFARIIVKAWLYGWPQILFGKKMKLWTPVPGIATHLNIHALSPTIDWSTLMKAEAEDIELENTPGAGYRRPRESSALRG
jgi:glycosyltransferase involved in cell wall biosynthesis